MSGVAQRTENRVTGLHHAGLVVRDLDLAMATFRRLGFTVPEGAFPGLPTGPDGAHQAVGAGNTHLRFDDNFVELAAVVGPGGQIGANATMVPMDVPVDRLPVLREVIDRTAARIATALERFEGLHILAFEAPDLDAAADRLATVGVQHPGVSRLRQPVDTPEGTETVPVAYLEIDEEPGLAPEGRIVLAEPMGVDALRWQGNPGHPNGARRLISAVLCVPDAEVETFVRRYEAYTGRSAQREGHRHVLDLEKARLIIVGADDLAEVLPRAHAVALPAFVAYTLLVDDLAATASLLEQEGVPVHRTADGEVAVTPDQAYGVLSIFRENR